jgi:O-acetyl-ADP-ribose deacetylase (regulator of RNase III)
MIQYKVGDILQNIKSGVLLHSVNCQGVMGAGVARGIRDMYPHVYQIYKSHCTILKSSALGDVLPTKAGNLLILNGFGQESTGGHRAVSYDAIDTIFNTIYCSGEYDRVNKEIHTVKIGAGLGAGNWKVIEQIILTYLPESCNLYVWDFK